MPYFASCVQKRGGDRLLARVRRNGLCMYLRRELMQIRGRIISLATGRFSVLTLLVRGPGQMFACRVVVRVI